MKILSAFYAVLAFTAAFLGIQCREVVFKDNAYGPRFPAEINLSTESAPRIISRIQNLDPNTDGESGKFTKKRSTDDLVVFDEQMTNSYPNNNVPVVRDTGDELYHQFPANNNITSKIGEEQIEERAFLYDRHKYPQERSPFHHNEYPLYQKLLVEVSPESELVSAVGSDTSVVFDVTNNEDLPITVRFQLKLPQTIGLLSAFVNQKNLQFYDTFIMGPGQTVKVHARLRPVYEITEPQKITLDVTNVENYESKLKYVFIMTGSAIRRDDYDYEPTIYYYFNNNCAFKTSVEKCSKSFWSVDIYVESGSGLKTVVSYPRGAYPISDYANTGAVYYYYASNCCNRKVVISAHDVTGKTREREIDVTVWYNYTIGEWFGVIFTTLFVILLIGFIILLIVYCNRRKTLDLSYSSRYGSRRSPRSDN